MRNITLADWKVSDKQRELVNKVLDEGRLTYGPMHKKFEEKFAKMHNRKYAILTNSGTSALQVSLHYLKDEYGWEDQDEVLVPSVTFVATVNVVLQNNLKPVLVDVNPNYFDIDVNKIEQAITDKTRAIIPVPLLGHPCEMDKIVEIADKYNLRIVEDACETMFVSENGHPVGSRGDIGCFSSYLAHIISTGVGGFITTNDKKAHDDMRSMIWHGRDNVYLNIDDNKKDKKELIKGRFRFNRIGYSYRVTELEAALGIGELEKAEDIIVSRQGNATYLIDKLRGLKDFMQLPEVREDSEHAWMFLPLIIYGNDRDDFMLYLEERGVQTRTIMPLTNQPVYKNLFNEDDYPVAKYINNHGVLLGVHQYLEVEDLDYLVDVIRKYFK